MWKAEGKKLALSFGTPALVAAGDRTDLVVPMPGEVWGLDPDTGKLRWHAEHKSQGNVSPSVAAGDGVAYLTGGFTGKATTAVKVGGEVLWSAKPSSYVPTPLVHAGRLHWVGDDGLAVALDAATGKTLYSERLPGLSGGKPVYASPVRAGDRLYVVTRKGRDGGAGRRGRVQGVGPEPAAGRHRLQRHPGRLWPGAVPAVQPGGVPAGPTQGERPMTRLIGAVAAFAASAALTAGVAGFQPPEGGGKGGPPGKGDKKGKGEKGGPKGKKGFELGRVLPPHIADELDLTADQEKKIAALEKDVKAKLEKILTADQLKKIDEIGPPPMGGPGGGKEGAPMPKEKGDRPDRPGGEE